MISMFYSCICKINDRGVSPKKNRNKLTNKIKDKNKTKTNKETKTHTQIKKRSKPKFLIQRDSSAMKIFLCHDNLT